MAGYAPFPVAFHDEAPGEGEAVNPYARDEKLKRVWIKPGTDGADAPHRRHREECRHAAISITTRRTTRR